MARHWTFGQKIAAGYAVTIALTVAIGVVSISALRTVVASKDSLITVNARMLVEAEHLSALTALRMQAALDFALTKEEQHAEDMRAMRSAMVASIQKLKAGGALAGDSRLVDEIQRFELDVDAAMLRFVELGRSAAPGEAFSRALAEDVEPKRRALREAINAFVDAEQRLMDEAVLVSTRAASATEVLVTVIGIVAILFAAVTAWMLTGSLAKQIGTAVGNVESSSSELQAAANQQATGAKQQATAMTEITTTISELVGASRQIALSAQHVAQIAEETAGSARVGRGTIEKAQDSMGAIRRQVDVVVEHMLDLAKKSQEIGLVLEMVTELAEQTNILAINATIEAAGAGDAGKRFAVVADEIRKLADRVAGSTKEIRVLIDDVRGAVNKTIMATETGSKAADAGSKQVEAVANSFIEIASRVTTTTDAAQEIELSTKQQTTAVEQVNVAVANVAQTTRETEASAGQTLQTASQLAALSKELRRLVQPQSAA
jgi:methyl-accepting chemotaxis protein